MLSAAAYPNSYYAATSRYPLLFEHLEGQRHADVCIIGAGFSGINTAIELAERGLSVIVLEAKRIGWGASGRNGGQLIRGVGHDLAPFRNRIGEDGIAYLEKAGLESVKIVAQRIEQHAIDCDLRWGFAELAHNRKHLRALEAEQEHLIRLGSPGVRLIGARHMAEIVDSQRYCGALLDPNSGHLHPLNLALGEAQVARQLGVRLYENSPALSIRHGEPALITCPNGQVTADSLVLAGNAYLGELEPWLSSRVLPAGSYIVATEPLDPTLAQRLIPHNLALCDMRLALDYYRLSADNRLLFGGACHYSGRDPKNIERYMRPKMLRVFPQLEGIRLDYHWGGLIDIGANRFPQIGQLPGHPNAFYAQGYSGHGLNVTHLLARLLGEVITERASRGFEVFNRVQHRAFPGGRTFRSPLLALGMLWYRIREVLG